MRPYSFVLNSLVGVLVLGSISTAFAKPEPLAALFQQPKANVSLKKGVKNKTKATALSTMPVPEEYSVYFKAKSELASPADSGAIENSEKEILLSKMHAQSRTLDRELEEVFYALEIKRGTKLLAKKSWKVGLDSYHRALGGLSQF